MRVASPPSSWSFSRRPKSCCRWRGGSRAMAGRKTSQPGRRQLNIKTLAHLARRVNVPLEILEGVATSVVFQYKDIPLRKKDSNAVRRINAPGDRLKGIQRRINDSLLGNLWLPD